MVDYKFSEILKYSLCKIWIERIQRDIKFFLEFNEIQDFYDVDGIMHQMRSAHYVFHIINNEIKGRIYKNGEPMLYITYDSKKAIVIYDDMKRLIFMKKLGEPLLFV
jgi:hypothetical protein